MSCSGAIEGPVFPINVGDLLPLYIVDARGCDGVVDWTGWTLIIEFSGPVIVTGTATGTELGVITYEWQAGDTDIPGDYEVLIRAENPEGLPRTFRIPGIVRITAV
jgi:hypothetical protein